MKAKNYNVYFFFFTLAVVTIAAFYLVKDLVVVFILAAVLAHSFTPFYEKTLKFTRNRKGLSSALICLLVALIILIPLFLISVILYNEIQMTIFDFSANPEKLSRIVSSFNNALHSFDILKNSEFFQGFSLNQGTVVTLVSNSYQYVSAIIQGAYWGVGYLFLMTIIFFFCLFYLLIDGKRIIRKIMQLSPIKDCYEELLMQKFNAITRGTMRGTVFLAVIYGFIGGILFWATGVSAPIVLAIITAISTVIPVIGTGIVWIPVGIIMILLGHLAIGLFIIIFGFLVFGSLDNILRPKLIGKNVQMHPILILFATLGGIEIFGLTGFIIGPIIMATCVAFWEIYSLEFKGQLKKFNRG